MFKVRVYFTYSIFFILFFGTIIALISEFIVFRIIKVIGV